MNEDVRDTMTPAYRRTLVADYLRKAADGLTYCLRMGDIEAEGLEALSDTCERMAKLLERKNES